MNKRMMVLALAVVSAAMFALPALASAHQWHIDKTTTFEVTGGAGSLTTTVGTTINCATTTGGGKYITTTSGTITLTFHECKLGLVKCTSPGHEPGTITTDPSALPFDNIMIANNTPGILVTPDPATTEVTPGNATYPGAKRVFAHFFCGGVTTTVFGNGVIGDITAPTCGTASKTATVSFTSGLQGHQTFQTWTGNKYDLEATLPGSNLHTTASIDAVATITFPEARTGTCTNT